MFIFYCQYGVVDNQPVCCTFFALKIEPVEGQNVGSMFLISCLAVIFGLKLKNYSLKLDLKKGFHPASASSLCKT